jgi:hypothetical protein
MPEISQWVIFALDLSLSRTGWAVSHIKKEPGRTEAVTLGVGSVKPESASAPVWVRSVMIGQGLMEVMVTPGVRSLLEQGAGIMFAVEAATPRNDFLTSISRVTHSIFFAQGTPFDKKRVYTLSVNASTLRSLMHLSQRGAGNKKENIEKAFTYVSKQAYPKLDSDACDAVLLAAVGEHACRIFLGYPDEVPENFINTLCNAAQEVKGKGRRQRVVTKGILHRPEYFYTHETQTRTLLKKDASSPSKKLSRSEFKI